MFGGVIQDLRLNIAVYVFACAEQDPSAVTGGSSWWRNMRRAVAPKQEPFLKHSGASSEAPSSSCSEGLWKKRMLQVRLTPCGWTLDILRPASVERKMPQSVATSLVVAKYANVQSLLLRCTCGDGYKLQLRDERGSNPAEAVRRCVAELSVPMYPLDFVCSSDDETVHAQQALERVFAHQRALESVLASARAPPFPSDALLCVTDTASSSTKNAACHLVVRVGNGEIIVGCKGAAADHTKIRFGLLKDGCRPGAETSQVQVKGVDLHSKGIADAINTFKGGEKVNIANATEMMKRIARDTRDLHWYTLTCNLAPQSDLVDFRSGFVRWWKSIVDVLDVGGFIGERVVARYRPGASRSASSPPPAQHAAGAAQLVHPPKKGPPFPHVKFGELTCSKDEEEAKKASPSPNRNASSPPPADSARPLVAAADTEEKHVADVRSDNPTVRSSDGSTVRNTATGPSRDGATVRSSDGSIVRKSDTATGPSRDSATVRSSDFAALAAVEQLESSARNLLWELQCEAATRLQTLFATAHEARMRIDHQQIILTPNKKTADAGSQHDSIEVEVKHAVTTSIAYASLRHNYLDAIQKVRAARSDQTKLVMLEW